MRLRRGRYLVRRRWFRIYINGSYSKLEIDFGRMQGWELTLHFKTRKGFFTCRLNPSFAYLERQIRIMDPSQM